MTIAATETDRDRFVPRAYVAHHPITVAFAEGAHLVDTDGRRYIDFAGGIGVVNVGHRAPAVVAAIHAQVDRFLHVGPVTSHDPYVELARRLAERVGPTRELQTLFVNSGAEAVENAVKLARHATGRSSVIAFDRSFHGRTLLTATLTGKTSPHKTQPGAMAPEIFHVPYPYPLRPTAGINRDQQVDHALAALDGLLETRIGEDKLAAVIVEPVQGEGGFIVPPPGFLRRLAEWCRQHKALLIVDEIQTGFGRTGRFFAFEHEAIEPDIVTIGKSIANGLPLAAVVAPRAVWDHVYPGDIGGTYGGNPVACAAGLAVLDIFDQQPLLERSIQIGARIHERLAPLSDIGEVAEVRGLGAMVAIEFVKDGSLEADPELATRVTAEARSRGLIVIRTGSRMNAVRLLPPLTADNAVVDEAMDILLEAIRAAIAVEPAGATSGAPWRP